MTFRWAARYSGLARDPLSNNDYICWRDGDSAILWLYGIRKAVYVGFIFLVKLLTSHSWLREDNFVVRAYPPASSKDVH
jgi:hypothetical protein